MIILLEGPEAAGKSTLAKLLEEQTGYPVVHMDKPKTDEEKQNMYMDYMNKIQSVDNVIFDRCWYSEMVYGPIMRDKSYISHSQMCNLESALVRKGAMIIHCTDNVALLWERCNERGEDYVTDAKTLVKITQGFEDLLHGHHHSIPVVRYELSNTVMS